MSTIGGKVGAPQNNSNAIKDPKDVRTNRSFKATDAEMDIIQANASKVGMSVSKYIRYLCTKNFVQEVDEDINEQ